MTRYIVRQQDNPNGSEHWAIIETLPPIDFTDETERKISELAERLAVTGIGSPDWIESAIWQLIWRSPTEIRPLSKLERVIWRFRRWIYRMLSCGGRWLMM